LDRARLGLATDNVADGDGVAVLTAVRVGAIGGDNVDDKLATLVIEFKNLRSHTFTVVECEDGDGVEVDCFQPLRKVCIRHFSSQHNITYRVFKSF
jgi:hypothetical protein